MAKSGMSQRKRPKSQPTAVPFYSYQTSSISSSLRTMPSVHKHSDSILDDTKLEPSTYGVYNILFLLLILNISGDLISSISRHGVLIDLRAFIIHFLPTTDDIITSLFLLLIALCMIEITLGCEVILSSMSDDRCNLPKVVEYVVLVVVFTLPLFYSFYFAAVKKSMVFDPTAWYVILFMKLFSFITFNRWYKTKNQHQDKDDNQNNHNISKCKNLHYPHNLTRSNMYYFILAPTLCYEPFYPRTDHIRPSYLLKKSFHMVITCFLIVALAQQLFVPAVVNFTKSLKSNYLVGVYVELIHLSVYVNLMWLLLFYLVFHCFLNTSAEILTFGDRGFYFDWWNSSSIAYFWKSWNIPVHRWFKRHVYQPLFDSGYNRLQSSFVVFFLSAIFHEYMALSVLKLASPWSFLIMISQVPMSFFVDCVPNPCLKNLVFWLTILTAQLSGTILYAHFYHAKYHQAMITAGINVESLLYG